MAASFASPGTIIDFLLLVAIFIVIWKIMREILHSLPNRLKEALVWMVGILLFACLGSMVIFPPGGSIKVAIASASMQTAHTLGLCLYAYAKDHDGAYPTGKSSTEVFQKLIDGNYLSDPAIFYSHAPAIPGKVRPTSKILKPENVCWDVTVPLDRNSPDSVPVVFLTGYRIEYRPNGNAIPLLPMPASSLFGASVQRIPGLAVCYHDNSARFRRDDGESDRVVKAFISPNFTPGETHYRQLTPDGPLPP